MAGKNEKYLKVAGKTLKFTNLDTVLYPEAGFTKWDVIQYYRKIAPVLLKHLASLEMHTYLAKSQNINQPDFIAFDLDPGEPARIEQCCAVALQIKEVFDSLGLKCFPKSSGSKGLQIYLPLNTPTTYDQTKPFSKEIALLLEKRHPKQIVSNMAKVLRPGKVLIDWSQNSEHKTTVCAYSLRAKEHPTVSTPLTWEEVKLGAKDGGEVRFEAKDVLERVERLGDHFEPVLTLKQQLPPLSAITELKLQTPTGPLNQVSEKILIKAPARRKPAKTAKKSTYRKLRKVA